MDKKRRRPSADEKLQEAYNKIVGFLGFTLSWGMILAVVIWVYQESMK